MKKLILLLCLISFACGGNSSNDSEKAKRTIHGKAAIGAFIDEGAQIQVRPAPVNGIPCDIIESAVADGQGTISVNVSSPTQMSGAMNIDSATPTGYIIRVYSSANNSWIYSYADNTDIDIVSNSNPYTDMLIRQFYVPDTPVINIDAIFTTGFLQDGVTPIEVPDGNNIIAVMDVMSNMLKDTYNVSDIQNALTDNWQIGSGLDHLLDIAGGAGLGQWLQYEFEYLFEFPDALISMSAIEADYQPVGNSIAVEIWTAYGNTGNVTVIGQSGWPYPWANTLMVKQPDSVTGKNHYKATLNFPSPYQGDNILILIDDYTGGQFPVALRRP